MNGILLLFVAGVWLVLARGFSRVTFRSPGNRTPASEHGSDIIVGGGCNRWVAGEGHQKDRYGLTRKKRGNTRLDIQAHPANDERSEEAA